MLISLPYVFAIHCIEKRKRKASRHTVMDSLPVLAEEIAAIDAPEVGFTQVGERKRIYRVFGDQLYVHATYPDGAFVKAADLQRLLERMPWPRDQYEWNFDDFFALSIGEFSAFPAIGYRPYSKLEIRKHIWDDQLQQKAAAAARYSGSMASMEGLLLFRASEPAWVIEERPKGYWQVRLESHLPNNEPSQAFLVTELHRAHEFVRAMAGVEMIVPAEIADLIQLKRDDGAALRQIAIDILRTVFKNPPHRWWSMPTSLLIELAAAEIERQPDWLSSPSPYVNVEMLRRRWIFEWERLEKEPWWISHRCSSEELANLSL